MHIRIIECLCNQNLTLQKVCKDIMRGVPCESFNMLNNDRHIHRAHRKWKTEVQTYLTCSDQLGFFSSQTCLSFHLPYLSIVYRPSLYLFSVWINIRLSHSWQHVCVWLNQHLKSSLRILVETSEDSVAWVFIYPVCLSHRWSVCLAGYGIVIGSFCLYCVDAAVSQKWWGHILRPVPFYGICWLWRVRVFVFSL